MSWTSEMRLNILFRSSTQEGSHDDTFDYVLANPIIKNFQEDLPDPLTPKEEALKLKKL